MLSADTRPAVYPTVTIWRRPQVVQEVACPCCNRLNMAKCVFSRSVLTENENLGTDGKPTSDSTRAAKSRGGSAEVARPCSDAGRPEGGRQFNACRRYGP